MLCGSIIGSITATNNSIATCSVVIRSGTRKVTSSSRRRGLTRGCITVIARSHIVMPAKLYIVNIVRLTNRTKPIRRPVVVLVVELSA